MEKGYRGLQVWHKSIELTVKIYQTTKGFPKEELFGITSQIRRAASSIPANISEGSGRASNGQYAYLLGVANGSLCELETFIELAFRLELIQISQRDEILEQCMEIGKMLRSLRKKILQISKTTDQAPLNLNSSQTIQAKQTNP